MPAHQAHSHSHAHGAEHTHSHSHGEIHAATKQNEKRVLVAMVLTFAFMGIEFVGAYLSGSLALKADAFHSATDAIALMLAWWAFRISMKPADSKRTYGYSRFPIIAAYTNAIILFALTAEILHEAFDRYEHPTQIEPSIMMIVAAIGLVINLVNFVILHRGAGDNMNLQGAALHVLGDALVSITTIIGGIVIYYTGWTPIDLWLSVLVSLVILRSAYILMKKSAHILLQGSPEDFCYDTTRQDLVAAIPEIKTIDRLHIWQLSNEKCVVTLHCAVEDQSQRAAIVQSIENYFDGIYNLDHCTIQLRDDQNT